MVKTLLISLLLTIPSLAKEVREEPILTANEPVSGTKTLLCIGIKYQNLTKYADLATAQRLCASVSRFYKENSRGLLQLKTKSVFEVVPFIGNKANVYKAEAYAIDKHKGYDLYAVFGMFYPNQHAGKGVAHLNGFLQRDIAHEVGHLLGLGHAGSYRLGVYDQYADAGSVMGRFPSEYLTAPQYRYQGWLPQKEVAFYEPGKTYELKKISNFADNGILSAVIVDSSLYKLPKATTRDAFISSPSKCFNGATQCLAIHLRTPGGSQKVATFTKEFHDRQFTGLYVKVLGVELGKIRFRAEIR